MANLLESKTCCLAIGKGPGSNNNVIFGYQAMGAISGGQNLNTAIGHKAGFQITGYRSTFVGYKAAAYNGAGFDEVHVGSCAGIRSNAYTVSVGHEAARCGMSGSVAIGKSALCNLNNGAYNNTVGVGSFASAASSSYTVSVGSGAGFNGGYNARRNVNIGYHAGDFAYQGLNVAVGMFAGRFGNHSNTTHIGHYSYGANYINNAFVIGRYSASNSYVYVGWTNVSDSRDKTNVETLPDNLGLNFVRKLRPVKFKYDTRAEYMFKCGCEFGQKDGTLKKTQCNYGFLAQEVEQAAKDLNVNFDGVYYDTYNDKYGLKITELLSPIVKSIQELNNELDLIEQQIG